MIKAGDQVFVCAPEPRHAHMKGATGKVQHVRVDKATRKWVAAVNFAGGVGVFSLDEIDPLESANRNSTANLR